jgi:hypothetical protein
MAAMNVARAPRLGGSTAASAVAGRRRTDESTPAPVWLCMHCARPTPCHPSVCPCLTSDPCELQVLKLRRTVPQTPDHARERLPSHARAGGSDPLGRSLTLGRGGRGCGRSCVSSRTQRPRRTPWCGARYSPLLNACAVRRMGDRAERIAMWWCAHRPCGCFRRWWGRCRAHRCWPWSMYG